MESFTALPDQTWRPTTCSSPVKRPKTSSASPTKPRCRLVNSILTQAVRESASDIHISPEKDSIQIRFRIDGKLRKTPSPPKSVGASIVSRIKILANMDISITRVPQDGRFTMMVDRREINVRVSTLPTIYGENVVMRLLDMSTNHVYTLDKLGMSDKDCKTISQTIERPYGMILSTGPTGSGKSTSLYSILQLLNKPDVNAITLEDPVEYRIDGIRQVQLNVRAGMTFASGLRSILR
ncbi:MAG: GspE/PulE family protein, partial [Bilophila wadsworthia]